MSATVEPAPSQPDPSSHSVTIPTNLDAISQCWATQEVENHSLAVAPGPAGIAHRVGLWLNEWSMRSFSHDTHHWATKSEVLRGLKNIGQRAAP